MYVLADSYVFIAETASQCKHRKYIPPIPILPYPALSLPTHCHSRHLIPPIPSHPKPSQAIPNKQNLASPVHTPCHPSPALGCCHRICWRVVSGDSKRDSQVLQPNHIPPLIPPQLHQLNPVPLQCRQPSLPTHVHRSLPHPHPTPPITPNPSHHTHHTPSHLSRRQQQLLARRFHERQRDTGKALVAAPMERAGHANYSLVEVRITHCYALPRTITNH